MFVVFFFFLLALFCLFCRLGYLQIFKSSQYQSIAENQSHLIVEMPPARGKIFDSKNRELALDVRLDSLYAVSREIKNKSQVAEALTKILGKIGRAHV